MRRLALNSMVLSLGSYVAATASGITFLLAARTFGPTVFGPLSGAIGLAVVVAAFGDFGVNGWAVRALARNPASVDLFTQTLTAKLILAAVLAGGWVAVAFVALGQSPLKPAVALLAVYLTSQVVTGTLTVPYRASENMTVVSIVAATDKAVALTVWLALQAVGIRQPEAFPIALAAGGVVSMACAVALIPRRFLAIAPPSMRQFFALWQSSFSFGMVGVSSQILRADVAIVSAVAGPFAAGMYSAPSRLTTFLTVIPASFSVAVFPRIARSSVDGTSRRGEVMTAGAMLAVMALLLGVIAVAAPALVQLVLGHAYAQSVSVLRVYLLVVLINSANQPLLTLLQAEGNEKYAARVMVVAAIVGLLAVAGGALIGGAIGAAAGALLLQVIQLLLFAAKALQKSHNRITGHVMADVTDGTLEVHWLPAESEDMSEGHSG